MAGKKNPVKTEATRQKLLEVSFGLFTQRNIGSVSLGEITKAAGYGPATVYRYYSSKPKLVVAVATWKWSEFAEEYRRKRPDPDAEGMTAAQLLEFFLDSFLDLYRYDRDLLRFNQFFNVYIRAENIDAETLSPYREFIGGIAERFHAVSEKASQDHTVRTDVPVEEMFSTALHLMLAAVTRYAVGLVYSPGGETAAARELETLKRAILREYTAGADI